MDRALLEAPTNELTALDEFFVRHVRLHQVHAPRNPLEIGKFVRPAFSARKAVVEACVDAGHEVLTCVDAALILHEEKVDQLNPAPHVFELRIGYGAEPAVAADLKSTLPTTRRAGYDPRFAACTAQTGFRVACRSSLRSFSRAPCAPRTFTASLSSVGTTAGNARPLGDLFLLPCLAKSVESFGHDHFVAARSGEFNGIS